MHKQALIILSILFLFGCSDHQMKKDAVFNKSSQSGVIVLGVILDTPYVNPSLIFRKYDPNTSSASKNETFIAQPEGSNLQAQLDYRAKDIQPDVFVLNMPAGHWFLECISASKNDGRTINSNSSCFSLGTIAFKVEEGRASYIGEYTIKSWFSGGIKIKKLADNVEKGREKLKGFKYVDADLELQKPSIIKYECVKKLVWINRYECDPDRMQVMNVGVNVIP